MSTVKRRRSLYPKEQFATANDAVRNGKMTSVKASQVYSVPQSTVRSHIIKPELRIGAGRQSYLTKKQEEYLVEIVKSLGKIDVRVTKALLKKIAGEYIKVVTNDKRLCGKYEFTEMNILFYFLR